VGSGVTAATLTGWRAAFLAAGEATLTTKPSTSEELESYRLRARLGAALIERDLLNEKIAILEANPSQPSSPSATSPTCSARTKTGCTSCRSTCSRKTGCLRVYGVGEDGVTAFTRNGIKCLQQIIADERAAPRAPP
jgi:transposase